MTYYAIVFKIIYDLVYSAHTVNVKYAEAINFTSPKFCLQSRNKGVVLHRRVLNLI